MRRARSIPLLNRGQVRGPIRGTVLALALLLAVPLLAWAAPLPAAHAAAAAVDPLQVSIDGVSPAAIPRHGPVMVTGVVSNASHETWTNVQAFPLTSQHPITDPASLAAAAQTPANTDLGNRLLTVGEKLGDIAPGDSVRFRLQIPRRALRIDGTPGVYWLGVQVLGTDAHGRDGLADGRARTFLPLVAPHTRPVPVSLIVPIRQRVPRAGDGSLLDAGQLADQLGPQGRLGDLVDWAQQAPPGGLTWLLDPAVVQAAADLADGDPDLGVHRAGTHPSASPSPTPSDGGSSNPTSPSSPSSPSASSTPPTGAGAPAAPELTDQGRSDARTWLAHLVASTGQQPVLALPYADPDVSAIATAAPSLLAAGGTLARATLTDQHITATPAVAPPDGYLDPAALPALPRPATVLLSDHPADGASGRAPVEGTASSIDGRTLVTAASGATSPPSGSPHTSLQLRQRLLSDAAIRSLDGAPRPLVVQLPLHFDPGAGTGAGFFGGLSAQPWIALGPLPAGTPRSATPALPWPKHARAARVGPLGLATARAVRDAGMVLAQLIDSQSSRVQRLVIGSALSVVSYHARATPRAARAAVQPLLSRVRQLLGMVAVLGTDFVTLSGDSGYLTVAVVNGLDQPVTVGLQALAGAAGVHIDAPAPGRLAAGQRSTLRLQAHSRVPGVHVVRLVPVTSQGLRVGDPLVFNLRTSQIGQFFWGVLAVLALGLIALVARRIRQRLTERPTGGLR